jgi:hypothetical protein
MPPDGSRAARPNGNKARSGVADPTFFYQTNYYSSSEKCKIPSWNRRLTARKPGRTFR